jgi:hypothetical protein
MGRVPSFGKIVGVGGGKPIKESAPDLYNITLTKNVTVAEIKRRGLGSIKFRRDLNAVK